ncbi:hypothetical protein GEMRC1_007424 [Eukaryota sp. GEM-RC1]
MKSNSHNVNQISEIFSELLDEEIELLLNRFLLRLVPLQIQASTNTLSQQVQSLESKLVVVQEEAGKKIQKVEGQIGSAFKILMHCYLKWWPKWNGYQEQTLAAERKHASPFHGAVDQISAIKGLIGALRVNYTEPHYGHHSFARIIDAVGPFLTDVGCWKEIFCSGLLKADCVGIYREVSCNTFHPSISNDPSFWKEIFPLSNVNIWLMPAQLRDNEELCRYIMSRGSAHARYGLNCCSDRLKGKRDFCEFAVSTYFGNFPACSQNLRRDPTFCPSVRTKYPTLI